MSTLCEMSERFAVINRAAFMQRATLVNGDWSSNALKLGIYHQHRETTKRVMWGQAWTGRRERPGGLETERFFRLMPACTQVVCSLIISNESNSLDMSMLPFAVILMNKVKRNVISNAAEKVHPVLGVWAWLSSGVVSQSTFTCDARLA